jgi:hypothetical protein
VKRDSVAHRRVTKLLTRLSENDDAMIAEHARWAINNLSQS